MLPFDARQMATLGDAALFLDGDTVYVYSFDWCLVVTDGARHLSNTLLGFLDSGRPVDWLMLNPKEVFREAQKFIPARGGGARDIFSTSARLQISARDVRKSLEEHQADIWAAGHSLTDAFRTGAVSVAFQPNVPEGEKGWVASTPTARLYTFRFKQKIVSANAPSFRTLYETKFAITCQDRAGGPPRVFGLYRSEETEIFGYLYRAPKTEIRVSDEGLPLHYDAVEVSWLTPEEGLTFLQAPSSYKPGYGASASQQVQTTASASLLFGFAVLRWHGLTDKQINNLYEAGVAQGLRQRWAELLQSIDAALINGKKHEYASLWKEVLAFAEEEGFVANEQELPLLQELERRVEGSS